jgi:hypothetical protein
VVALNCVELLQGDLGGYSGPMRRSCSEEIGLRQSTRAHHRGARGLVLSEPAKNKRSSLHFFGEAPERRPWAIKRDDRPAAFAGRSE